MALRERAGLAARCRRRRGWLEQRSAQLPGGRPLGALVSPCQVTARAGCGTRRWRRVSMAAAAAAPFVLGRWGRGSSRTTSNCAWEARRGEAAPLLPGTLPVQGRGSASLTPGQSWARI
ncbi:hypothetical protein FKM82_004901 [Ascaphus truei]